MDALELLAAQHVEVMHLFEKLESHPEPNAKSSIFEQIADDLAVHMTLEEELFYPAAYGARAPDLQDQAIDEHRAIKRLLVELMELNRREPKFDATLRVLEEEVVRHVEREERELFPEARQRLGGFALESLGDEMEARFQREMKESPGRNILDHLEGASGPQR